MGAVSKTLMRYAGTTALSMTPLTRSIAAPSLSGALVATTRLPDLAPARGGATIVAAVALSTIAATTDRELRVAANAVRQAMAVASFFQDQ